MEWDKTGQGTTGLPLAMQLSHSSTGVQGTAIISMHNR